ncbi:MAG TPA: hypothetical protein VMU16_05880 [Candidatus Binataceae bacterium]|nr:hypothetical protein [Candidatus Binataceae bacterium]
MVKLKRSIAGMAALLFLAPGAAMAKNYCITGFPNADWDLVGIGFKVPAKGACKAWNGFNPANNDNSPTTGVGCTSSDGTNLSLLITTSNEPDAFIESDQITLSLPSASGEYVGQLIISNVVVSFDPTSGIHGQVCTTKTIPAAIQKDSAPARSSNNRLVR